MQLTVRIPDDYTEKLDKVTKKMGLKRSDIIRLALKQFFEESSEKDNRTPFQKVSHFLGIVESGIGDLGQRHREYLIQKMRRGS